LKGRTFRCAVPSSYFCHAERASARERSAVSTFSAASSVVSNRGVRKHWPLGPEAKVEGLIQFVNEFLIHHTSSFTANPKHSADDCRRAPCSESTPPTAGQSRSGMGVRLKLDGERGRNQERSVKWISSGELNYNLITDTLEHISDEAVEKTNLKIHPVGTFLMAITGLEAAGTRGACAIVGSPATTNQSCMAIYTTPELKTEYLYHYYVLRGNQLALRYCQGTKQQSYTAKLVKLLPIDLPSSVEEQTAIASVHDKRQTKGGLYRTTAPALGHATARRRAGRPHRARAGPRRPGHTGHTGGQAGRAYTRAGPMQKAPKFGDTVATRTRRQRLAITWVCLETAYLQWTCGERGRNRTFNLLIKSQLLCQLSYAPFNDLQTQPQETVAETVAAVSQFPW
jgi:type I restriction modification DNA specificity protein